MTRLATLTLLLAAATESPAWACGGLFCNNDAPVDQSGEDIFFFVDQDAGTVTAHVQIQYEGPSENFAWIVPVPTVPELSVGTDTFFSLLSTTLSPSFALDVVVEGQCKAYTEDWYTSWTNTPVSTSSTTSASTSSDDGVDIIAQVAVGPYDAVTLQADSSGALLTWLVDNGYDLPAQLDPVLAPYVAGGQYFVAIKLQKDQDAGDIAPLVMTYPGQVVSIPIQLTSIAATPDMRLRVNILGSERAVPESYLHLEINPFAIDWWNRGDNYDQVVTRAAREAGGHGFATDYAGKPPALGGIYSTQWDTAELATLDVVRFLEELGADGYPADETLLTILSAHVPVPDGVDPVDVFNCPSCYADELLGMPFDAAACAADIEALIVTPRRDLTDLFAAHPYVTRLTSSMSPADMTVDPTFTFNADLPEVPRYRRATQTVECQEDLYPEGVPSRLTIGDYPDLRLPSEDWLAEHQLTYHGYILDLHEPSNELVQQTSASLAEDVVDNHPLIEANILAFNAAHAAETGAEPLGSDPDDGKGCGCSNVGGSGAGLLPLLVLGLARRRRS